MSSSTLELVLEKLKELTPTEQQQVRELLDALNEEAAKALNDGATPSVSEDEFHKLLLAKGVISKIPSRQQDPTVYEDRRLLEVSGKPLSEIIIEDRR